MVLVSSLYISLSSFVSAQPKGESTIQSSNFSGFRTDCTSKEFDLYEKRTSQASGITYDVKILTWKAPPGRDIIYATNKSKNSSVVFILLDDGSVYETTDFGSFVGWNSPTLRSKTDVSGNYSGYKKLVGDVLYTLSISGVFVSRDTGGTWRLDTLGVGPGLYNDIAVDTFQYVYLAHANGLFKQHPDSGVWHRITTMPAQYMTGVFVDRKNRIFASTYSAVYVSTDTGSTWHLLTAGLGGAIVTSFGDDAFSNIYALGGGMVFRSDSGNSAWVRIDTSISNLILDPINSYSSPYKSIAGDSTIYLATNYGLFTSTDQGNTWVEDNSGISATTLYGFLKSPTRQFISTALGLYYENQGDTSWIKTFPAKGYQTGNAIYVDNAGNLYTLGSIINAYNSQSPNANWKSIDNGSTWFPDTAGLGVAAQSGIPIYFADENGIQHYSFSNAPAPAYRKSSGSSWTPDTAGLSGIPQSYPNVFASDKRGNLYWAITTTASNYAGLLYKRPLAGGTWVLDTAGLQGAIVYSVTPDKNGNIYAGTYGGGIYKKTGNTWSGFSTPNGLGGSSAFVTAVDSSGALWAGFSTLNGFNYLWHGIFYTTDNGSSWNFAGLDSISVRALVVYGDTVFAVTYNDGLYALTKNGLVNSVKKNGSVPNMYSLSQNYPNPFNPATMIEYQLNEKSFVTLTLFDVLGRRVATLVNGEQTGGSHFANWDASAFASGVYFYRLKAGDFIETKKMLLMK